MLLFKQIKQIIIIKRLLRPEKHQNRMKSQQVFLNSLLDFSNIPSKRTEYNHHYTNSNIPVRKSESIEPKISHTDRLTQHAQRPSQQAINNQKLLKAFNNLREKLSNTNRQNLLLKESLQNLEKEYIENKQQTAYYTNQIHALNKKCTSLEQQCNSLKLRLNNVKQTMTQSDSKKQDIERNKHNLQRLFEQNKRLKQELKVSMELSIQEKLNLEQQIQTLRLREIQHTKSEQQLQSLLSTKTSELIRLENEYRKFKLIFQEQQFAKTVNTESMFLQKQNQQLRLIKQELQTKLKKEKNKKYELQTKLLELQEKVRLFGTRTDIYEGQLDSVMKKIRKVTKEQLESKKQANQALNQKLTFQQKFYHSLVIAQELISRVKRQLKGDAVELAKTCEFRLNKLKNDEKLDLKQKPIVLKRSKSASSKKIRSQSVKKQEIQFNNQQDIASEAKEQINHQPLISNKEQNVPKAQLSRRNSTSKTILKERNPLNISNTLNELQDVKKRLFNDVPTVNKNIITSEATKSVPTSKAPLSYVNDQTNSLNLQAKIRKQRQIMQRKLREKILYHKIDDATSSPVRNQLRQDYLNIHSIDFPQC